MGTNGLEPSTSRLSGVRSNHLMYAAIRYVHLPVFPTYGGDEEDRTPDPLLAKQVLSQLSYTPAVESSHEPSKLNNETTSELPFIRPTLSGHP